MSSKVSMEEAIDLLVKVQEMDRVRDRLQRKLDQVPKKLKGYTDGIASLKTQVVELTALALSARSEADRAELEVVRHGVRLAPMVAQLGEVEYRDAEGAQPKKVDPSH